MSKIFLKGILAVATIAALSACIKEKDAGAPSVPTMTICASVPEEALTKASFSVPVSGTGLHLAWQAGDCIRVISGSNSAQYDIQAGFTDHVAHFTGPVVAGSVFDVICPGTYASVAEAEAGNPSLTQTGNGSTSHLVFTAKLANVAQADLENITFSDDWVSKHAGTSLKRGGIVKFVLTLPDAVTAPKKVVMTGIGKEVSVNITGVDLTSEHVLTAYAQCGWDDVAIPAWTSFTVGVLNGDGTYYASTNSIKSAATLKAGAQNIITITNASSFTEQLFAGGEGTESAPYLIASAKHLDNMRLVMDHNVKRYFRLINDIDMESYLATHPWAPLNMESPYDMPVNLDGDGFTIDHFKVVTSDDTHKQTGFFGLLYGEVYDLSFTNAVVNNTYGKPTGILAGYCGYDAKVARVWNVHVQGTLNYNSSLSGADGHGPVGGMAGRVNNAFIDSSSADCVVYSTKNYAGGLFGIDWGTASTIRNCWTSGSVRGDQRVGGICGGLIKNETAIINCFSTASLDGSAGYGASRCAGGIAGFCNLDSGSNYTTNQPDNVIQGCIAWQDKIYTRTQNESGNFYSAGAIAGITATHNYLVNCLRRSDMVFTDYASTLVLYDQENASPSTPLVVTAVAGKGHIYPYHGKSFAGTLSQAAKSLGWDETVWDLSGATPVLTGAVEVLPPAEMPSSGAASVPAGTPTGASFPEDGVDHWEVIEVEDGIKYYHYSNTDDSKYTSGGNTHQEAYVVSLDLNNPDYEVKIVYTTSAQKCSEVFSATGALAAINAGYEKASIALKANAVYDGSSTTLYSEGYPVSMMPNNTIGDTGVPNWKSEGTFYCNGARDIQMAFDGYDGSTSTWTKSIKQERLFYQLCTDDKPGLISSAPMLIQNYNQVGKQFKTNHPYSAGENAEAPYTHQTGLYPRTAVALTADNHLLLFVCDGRYSKAVGGQGMSAYWVTDFLARYFDAQYALNLDGGGSTTMCVKDNGDMDTNVVNYPWDNYSSSSIYDHAGERARDSFIVIVPAGSL